MSFMNTLLIAITKQAFRFLQDSITIHAHQSMTFGSNYSGQALTANGGMVHPQMINDKNTLNLASEVNRAVTKFAGKNVNDPNAKQSLAAGVPIHCVKKTQEAQINAASQANFAKCQQIKMARNAQIADSVSAIMRSGSTNESCTKKLNYDTFRCDMERSVSSYLDNEMYQIKKNNNAVILMSEGKPLDLSLTEHFNYDITLFTSEEDKILDDPEMTLTFNNMGILLSKEGDLPPEQDKSAPECQKCFEKIERTIVDGQDKCALSCSDKDSQAVANNLPGSFNTKIRIDNGDGTVTMQELAI